MQAIKYVHSIKTKFTINNSYEIRQSVRLFANNQPAKIEIRSNTTTFKINSNPKKWLRLQFDFDATNTTNSVRTETQNTQNTFQQLDLKTKIDFIPSKNLTFGIEANKYQIEDGQNQTQQYLLMDCSANYHFKNSNVDLGIFLQNLTDEKSFKTLSFSENSFLSTDFRLRPRQFLAKLSFKF